MRVRGLMLFAGLAVAVAGCGKKDPPPPAPAAAPPSTGGPPTPPAAKADRLAPPPGAKGDTPFLEGTKSVPAGKEWNRDFVSKSGGPVAFRVTSPAPFAVTVIADRSYQAMLAGNGKGMVKSDVLLTVDARPPAYEGKLTVPPGRFWFIIENQSAATADLRLECYEGP